MRVGNNLNIPHTVKNNLTLHSAMYLHDVESIFPKHIDLYKFKYYMKKKVSIKIVGTVFAFLLCEFAVNLMDASSTK